jgi:hypothetical protein
MTETSYTPAATPASPAEAATKLETLSKNSEWASKVLTGSGPHVREFNDLIAKRSGSDKLDQVIAGTAEVPWLETTMNGELSTYKLATTVADLRERGLDDATIKQAISGAAVSKAEFDAVKRLHEDRLGDATWTANLLKGAAKERRELTLAQVVLAGGWTA